jgi:AcrR family transcriptional regulator
VSARRYSLGRRQAQAARTRSAILAAARRLVAELGPESSLGKVAEHAGVSRITVYNQFGSKAGLLEALAADVGRELEGAAGAAGVGPSDDLAARIEQACADWATNPDLHRQLQGRSREHAGGQAQVDRTLAERLAAEDRLRPGCSIKEAEDVIGILTSFPVFDRLHKGGRRSPSAVAEILLRMAAVFMTPAPSV